MKLLASIFINQFANGQGIQGGCTNGENSMACVTECPYTQVGKKYKSRYKEMFDGDDSTMVRLSPSPVTGMHKEEDKDFRFTMRFDKQKCSKAILNAINDRVLTLEVSDKSDVYDIESIYLDLETCPNWQQALYVQVKHSNPKGKTDWTYKPQANKHRDQFYLTVNGIRDIESTIGKKRSDVKACLEMVWIDRMDELGAPDADFTKCMMYDRCSKTPDWDLPTQAPSTSPATSTTPLPEFPPEDPLPDYNSTPYTYSCDGDICTLAMDDGQTFVGKKEGTILNFKNIPFAEPPIGELRWKAPRIITDYTSRSPVQATEYGFDCATFQTQDNNPNQNQNEDCLSINIQVQEWVIKNGSVKQPIVAHIHGGSFNFGTNTDNLQSLVSQGMVAFNINYRLGPYGFLNLDQREEGERYKGNWGLLDQLAGLKWIQMIGGIFGGDINQVTLDGCSAGSASGWHHITSEQSWPYFHRAVTNGISFPAGIYFEGQKTDEIRNHVLNHAGVSSIDELRTLSTGTLRLSFLDAKNTLSPSIKSAPTLDPMYSVVIDGDLIKDHLVDLVRDGHIRPNTPISMNMAKDDAWNFKEEAWAFMRDVKFSAMSTEILDAEESSGHVIPNPYPNTMFSALYPSKAERMINTFGCYNETDDCKEGFGRWVQATHWLCNARWALSGALKTNPDKYGPIWPMHFEEPNCDKDDDGKNTKTCHCAETAWVRGGRAWSGNALGQEMKTTWQKFYRNGAFDASSKMKSWEEMNFSMFNLVSSQSWKPGSVNDWEECLILDEIQEEQFGYTWGYTKEDKNGPPNKK